MGLESLEVVLEIEDKFAISLNDKDVAECRTMGELNELVANLVWRANTAPCASMLAFHRLRRALVTDFGLSRKSIRPDLPLKPILPRKSRIRDWQRLRTASGLEFPSLLPHIGLVCAWFGLVLLLLYLELLLPAIAVFFVGVLVMKFFRTEIRTEWATAGGLASAAGVRTLHQLKPDLAASGEEVANSTWPQLQKIVASITGWSPSDILPETRFSDIFR